MNHGESEIVLYSIYTAQSVHCKANSSLHMVEVRSIDRARGTMARSETKWQKGEKTKRG